MAAMRDTTQPQPHITNHFNGINIGSVGGTAVCNQESMIAYKQ